MKFWLAYALMTASLAAAVLLRGGVYPWQWAWCGLGISLAALLCVIFAREWQPCPRDAWLLGLLGALFACMIFQLVPLPWSWVAWLSPERWRAASAARIATGGDMRAWLALSVAPSATLQRLLDVVPAMAAFITARELAWRFRARPWLVVVPVVAVAWMESLLGLVQFRLMRIAGGEVASAAGTYVNRNHFAGLLEMAFPLAVLWAVYVWRKGSTRHSTPARPALTAVALSFVAACLLAGIIVSLSRMGFIATLAAGVLTAMTVLSSRERQQYVALRRRWRWALLAAVLVCVLIFLPTRELASRFANMAATGQVSSEMRLGIWRDTLHMTSAYRWTGCGLGAYERGLYLFKKAAPVNTVDFAHNDYLQILAEMGIVGFVLVMLIAGTIAWRLLDVVLRRSNHRTWELAVGLLCALLAIGLHGFVDFNLYIPANALVAAWLGGMAASPALSLAS
jgi:O-antigen ligase